MMKSWEYKLKHLHIERDGLVEVEQYLNRLGSEGWELVALVADFSGGADAYFKRPSRDEPGNKPD
jgi:hypothetical protein